MAEGGTQTFGDPDGYAAAFGDTRIRLTIAGPGDFTARLTRLRLQHMELFRCRESLPRIAYFSLPQQQMVLSFPIGSRPPVFGGCRLQNGDLVHHRIGERMHQRSTGACQWGMMSFTATQLAKCSEALIGQSIASPDASRILRPGRADALRFQHLFRQACRLAANTSNLIGRPEVARALEQEMLYAVIRCLAAEAEDTAKTRQRHAAVMVRFEEALTMHRDQKLNIPNLCTEIGVAERTLRMCCDEIIGISPKRYFLFHRLNRARDALRRADPSNISVSEIARDNQFLEFGRFAVTYRSIFGESPSSTLQRDRQK